MLEMIGKVQLNKRWYGGEDCYSDGDDVEEHLLDIVKNSRPEEYEETILREGSWPLLYHLSPIRENIIRWYPFREGASILELGAGCGAVTGALLNRGFKVCAEDLSLRRCRINAERHADSDDLEILVGPMEDVLAGIDRKFDYVLLIGVLEYAAVFSNDSEPQRRILDLIRKVLRPRGELIVAIENKLGMKYLAGCREDHTGRFYESVEGYPHHDGPLTYSRRELIDLSEACGFSCDFYYPYPDYKFPIKVFSDRWLPSRGELNRNWQCFDANRLQLFDESRANDVMIDAGLIHEFANSFLIRLKAGTSENSDGDPRVVFVKSSVERKPEFRHHTLILERDGERVVRKEAVSQSGKAHLRNMQHCRESLVDGMASGGRIEIAPCTLNEDGSVEFPFYTHKTLRDLLSESRSDVDAFLGKLLDFRSALTEAYGVVSFDPNDDSFRAFFDGLALERGMEALAVTNLDLNFDNVFLTDSGRYLIVDYEWVMPFKVPLSFVLYRALLVNQDMARFNEADREIIWRALGMDEALRTLYYQMELCFQRYVSGDDFKLEAFKNTAIDEADASIGLERMLDAVQAVKKLSEGLEEYREEHEKQARAIEELTKQRDQYRHAHEELSAGLGKYKEAHEKQIRAIEELTKQRDEYRQAYDEQAAAAEELTRQRDEYRQAYDEQAAAAEELTKQRDEYHAANDELWKRTTIAEQELAKTQAELDELIRKHTPFWRR